MFGMSILREVYDLVLDLHKKGRMNWSNTLRLILAHGMAIVAITMIPQVKWQTLVYSALLVFGCNIGIEVGAHRYFSHKSFKATKPLELLLIFLFNLAGQQSVVWWVRNHRTHHRHSDTIKDPHGVMRGWFYTQLGWLLTYPDEQ